MSQIRTNSIVPSGGMTAFNQSSSSAARVMTFNVQGDHTAKDNGYVQVQIMR